MAIDNVFQASRYVSYLLQQGGCGFFFIHAGYNPFHKLLTSNDGRTCYVMFKSKDSFFWKYKDFFETDGCGETVNLDVLQKLATVGIKHITIVYSNGKVYTVECQKWLNYANEHKTIREQYGGETTASIPVKMLEPFDAEKFKQKEEIIQVKDIDQT